MKTREKILVVIMIGAVSYAVFDLLNTKSMKRPIQKSVPTNKQAHITIDIRAVKEKVKNMMLSEPEKQVLILAESVPLTNPMLSKLTPKEFKNERTRLENENGIITNNKGEKSRIKKETILFQYTGCINTNASKVAILNGIAVSVGEKVGNNDYEVSEITPKRVILKNRLSGTKKVVLFSE